MPGSTHEDRVNRERTHFLTHEPTFIISSFLKLFLEPCCVSVGCLRWCWVENDLSTAPPPHHLSAVNNGTPGISIFIAFCYCRHLLHFYNSATVHKYVKWSNEQCFKSISVLFDFAGR